MKTTLLYFSPTHTTQKNLRAIASGMDVQPEEIDITLPVNREKNAPHFSKDDFVIFGAPCYGGRSPAFIEDYFKKVSADGASCAVVSVYGNRAFDDQLAEMYDVLTACGFKVIAAAGMIGEHSFSDKVAAGRPDEKDIAFAVEFGKALKAKLSENAETLDPAAFPGDRPYVERKPSAPAAPLTSDACVNCGLCAKKCPMGAIDPSDVKAVDASKCIRCNACVKGCPKHAKSFEGAEQIEAFMLQKFGEPRKEPVSYL